MKDKMKLSVNNREGTLIITISVIFVAMCILKGELFYARSNIEAIFSNLAYDLLLACGMTFVIILGGVDLSVGAVLALSGIICTLMIQKGINIVLAVGLGILFGGAIGAVNGWEALSPARRIMSCIPGPGPRFPSLPQRHTALSLHPSTCWL